SSEGASGREESDGVLRGRERFARWWEDDDLAREIGLSERQLANIDAAYEQLLSAARRSRQALVDAKSAATDALKAGDHERLGELAEARFEALQARARAETEWVQQLLDILEGEQMRKLVEQKPELVGRLLAPLR